MSRYEYRTLRVRVRDKWDGTHREALDSRRRSGGNTPDWILVLEDSGPPMTETRYTDEKGDDRHAFQERTKFAVLEYLNKLGEDGWQVIHCDGGYVLQGTCLLMRIL
jgi:hypothetical protein